MDYGKKEYVSYLDGVPMRIGPKFLPPRDIAVPVAFSYELPSDLLAEQYDFALEKKVIESERKRKLEENEAKDVKVASDIENFSKSPIGECDNTSTGAAAPAPVFNVGPNQESSSQSSSSVWHSNIILQPKPEVQAKTKNNILSDSKSTKTINLSDFESDASSPFDYVELQTINDLEELNTVFQGLSKKTLLENPQLIENTNSSDNLYQKIESESQEASTVSRSVSFPVSDNLNVSASETNCDLQKKHFEIGASNFASPITRSLSKTADSHLSYSYPSVSGLMNKPGLAYMNTAKNVYTVLGDTTNITYPALSQVPFISSHIGQSRRTSESDQNWFSSSRPSNSLRSSKSVSDLTNLSLNGKNILEEAERSHTPPAVASTDQRNTQHLKQNVTSHLCRNSLKEDILSSNGFLTSKVQHHTERSAEHPDPYEELSETEKQFVNSVTDMGFFRDQVARAVKHLGTDEKKVVEHLCHIQTLEDLGYDRFEAEAALHLHDYNKEEAVKFLDLLIQLQDLGFEKDAIKKALVQNKNNTDKVIEALLPS